MNRQTRKPRLFGSQTRRLAGASSVLLALAAQLAGARELSPEMTSAPEHRVQPGDMAFAAGSAGQSPVAGTQSSTATNALSTNTSTAAGPLGWAAAGILLGLALSPSGARRSTEGA